MNLCAIIIGSIWSALIIFMIVLVINHITGCLNCANYNKKLDRCDQRIIEDSENRKFEIADDADKAPIVPFYDANMLISQNGK